MPAVTAMYHTHGLISDYVLFIHSMYTVEEYSATLTHHLQHSCCQHGRGAVKQALGATLRVPNLWLLDHIQVLLTWKRARHGTFSKREMFRRILTAT